MQVESYQYPPALFMDFSAKEGVWRAWKVKDIPREESTNMIESQFAPMLEAPHLMLGQYQWMLDAGLTYPNLA
jgi:hypothetical protein